MRLRNRSLWLCSIKSVARERRHTRRREWASWRVPNSAPNGAASALRLAPVKRITSRQTSGGIIGGSRPRTSDDYPDASGRVLDSKCDSQVILRTSADKEGKRHRDFADLCLTTWLRRQLIAATRT